MPRYANMSTAVRFESKLGLTAPRHTGDTSATQSRDRGGGLRRSGIYCHSRDYDSAVQENEDVDNARHRFFTSRERNGERRRADIIERAAPIAGLGLTVAAVAAGITGEALSGALAPVIGTAVTGLVPVVVEAIRRRDDERAQRAARAHTAARRAWIEEAARHGREVAL